MPSTYVTKDLNGEETVGSFYTNEFQKTNQKEFRIEKVFKRKFINYMLNRNDATIRLIVGSVKKT